MVATTQINYWSTGPVSTPSVGASPWTFVNPENIPIMVYVSLGTVTDISIAQEGATWLACGLLGGAYRLNPGWSLKLTYAVAPTVKYVPI